jgi:methionine synthase II (cobalamin-independent)
MLFQFCEGMPCVNVDYKNNRVIFLTHDEEKNITEMAAFYEKFMAAQESDIWSAFAMSRDSCKGLYAFADELARRSATAPWLKIQITGPVTFSMLSFDEKNVPIFYNEQFRDCIIKNLAAKCRWQIEKFSEFSNNILCFIDEPVLSTIQDKAIPRQVIADTLGEITEAVHGAGALCGIHCCGAFDVSLIIEAQADIISFDSYSYADSLIKCADEVRDFLEADNYLAWGLVPSLPVIASETPASVISRFDAVVQKLEEFGLARDVLYRQSIISPSCGTGLLSEDDAQKVFMVLSQTAEVLKKRNV